MADIQKDMKAGILGHEEAVARVRDQIVEQVTAGNAAFAVESITGERPLLIDSSSPNAEATAARLREMGIDPSEVMLHDFGRRGSSGSRDLGALDRQGAIGGLPSAEPHSYSADLGALDVGVLSSSPQAVRSPKETAHKSPLGEPQNDDLIKKK